MRLQVGAAIGLVVTSQVRTSAQLQGLYILTLMTFLPR